MNKESQHEGWLIKSPPTKRIWRARWRRRWFTLKQGEIPEQFCLEYYTDRNCRKLKGVIDLDQCEQVDCGLRLENRKQKFQFMFDIKTPKRTYYLAADTEADMRDWVNCICQVCHLHDTKQSNELPTDEHRAHTAAYGGNSTNNTTTTSLDSSSGPSAITCSSIGSTRQSSNSDLLRRPAAVGVVEQQPLLSSTASASVHSNSDCVYVNAEYSNRETLLCDVLLDRQHAAASVQKVAATPTTPVTPNSQQGPTSPGAAVYLNSSVFQTHSKNASAARLAVNANGVVRKIPENLVLNNTPLSETPQHSVQPSPALSTASGPYIPISECFSGSPKFAVDSNNPTTPLNNLDPKFYDTPRSHNNIGLNLTNDQSYSPKITNCSLHQMANKGRNPRSDSDSESVFTDDDEWSYPLPLRENMDRSTRPSDSSIENESFVLTFSQRFSKLPDDAGKVQKSIAENAPPSSKTAKDPLDKLAKVLKNKNNLILDFKEQEKTPRDMPQFSDTENTSPAIGPRDSSSVVEESYDIPRSHNLPYCNMAQLFEKVASPEANPIAASTPNLIAGGPETATTSPAHVRTLPRPHCYTNAAPTKIEGNVFRYDFIEQGDLPPVNRKLKPKVNVEDKPPEEVPAKPPAMVSTPQLITTQQQQMDTLTNKLATTSMQSPTGGESAVMRPPTVNRKLKPDAYKIGKTVLSSNCRRSTGVPLSIMLPSNANTEGYIMEVHTLPRQLRSTNHTMSTTHATPASAGVIIQHQRTASAAAAVPLPLPQTPTLTLMQAPVPQAKNEHKLQYFDLDVANPPPINRQSMSVGNLNAPGSSRLAGLAADPAARAPAKSGVVYNSVDFVKTEAFKRIREERKKESEGISGAK